MIEIVKGSLLDSNEKYIAHQINCITEYAAGIAKTIFDKYPWSNSYSKRTLDKAIYGNSFINVGNIEIYGNNIDERFVINMNAQIYPGPPKNNETKVQRENWFRSCLQQIIKIPNLESIAFPEKIGCGLAKGNWDHYLKMITLFDLDVNNIQPVLTRIYRL